MAEAGKAHNLAGQGCGVLTAVTITAQSAIVVARGIVPPSAALDHRGQGCTDMRYLDSSGRQVPPHVALHNGQLRIGFRTVRDDVVADGERIGFDMAFMDAAPGNRITMHDTEQPDPAATAEAAYQASKAAPNNWRNGGADTTNVAEMTEVARAIYLTKKAMAEADIYNGWRRNHVTTR